MGYKISKIIFLITSHVIFSGCTVRHMVQDYHTENPCLLINARLRWIEWCPYCRFIKQLFIAFRFVVGPHGWVFKLTLPNISERRVWGFEPSKYYVSNFNIFPSCQWKFSTLFALCHLLLNWCSITRVLKLYVYSW